MSTTAPDRPTGASKAFTAELLAAARGDDREILRETEPESLPFDGTLPWPVDEATRPGQWRISAIQLLNWGTYHGHHSIPIHRDGTAFVGATGVGKSTFLDAVQTVLADGAVRFNTAAQDGDPRAGGRNFVTYMRGVRGQPLNVTEPDGTERWTDDALRLKGVVRSLVAVTWSDGRGGVITAALAMHLPATGTSPSDITRVYFWLPGEISALIVINALPADKFSRAELAKVLPTGARVFQNDRRGYISSLAPVIGLDADGDGRKDYEKIIKLLVKAASGKGISTVDTLFKQYALDESAIDSRVQSALSRFATIKDIWSQITTARDQIAALEPLVHNCTQYDQQLQRSRLAKTLDANPPRVGPGGQILGSVPRPLAGPVASWFYARALPALDGQIDALDTLVRRDEQAVADAERTADELKERINRLGASLSDAGGDRIEALKAALTAANQQLATAEQAAADIAQLCAQVGLPAPTDQASFTELMATVDKAIGDLQDRGRQAADRQSEATKALGVLEDDLRKLRGELATAMVNDHAVPTHLVRVRDQICQETGLSPDQLPFVSELIDVHPNEEDWRTAVEHTLGGFTRTMLVRAEEHRTLVSDAMHQLKLRSRLTVQGVAVDIPHRVTEPKPGTVAAKVVYDHQSPFTGWVRAQVTENYAARCVEDAEDARRAGGYTVTRTGLVRTWNDRWTKHAENSSYPIGFTNERLVADLTTSMNALQGRVEDAEAAERATKNEVEILVMRYQAYAKITGYDWESLDTETKRVSASTLIEELKALDTGEIHRLGELRDAALAERDKVISDKGVRTAQCKEYWAEREKLYERKEAIPQENEWPGIDAAQQAMLEALAAEVAPDPAPGTGEGPRDNPENVPGVETFREVERRTEVLRRRIASETWDGETERLRTDITDSIKAFARRWEDLAAARGTAFEDRVEYLALYRTLVDDALPSARAQFDRFYTSFTRRDLQEILRTLQDEEKAVDERLQPVNAVLSQVSFGAAGSSMRVVRRRETPTEYRDFVRRVEQVTSNVTGEDEAARDLRFRRHMQLMEWLASDSQAIARERSMALSLAHRAHFDAVVHSTTGDKRRYTGTDSASGGQSQELVSALLGAALRFQLDSSDGVLRYAPVIMDEGFVKADRGVTARAIETLQRLGFQVIMAVPEGKTEDAARAFGSIVSVAQHTDTKQSFAHTITFDTAAHERLTATAAPETVAPVGDDDLVAEAVTPGIDLSGQDDPAELTGGASDGEGQ